MSKPKIKMENRRQGFFSKLRYMDFYDDMPFYISNNITAPNLAYELYLKGYESYSAIDFYEDIFGFDNPNIPQLEPKRERADYKVGEYGAIALEINKKYKKRTTITYGLDELYDIIDTSDNFCLMAPVSYAGKKRTLDNMRFMYALCVEIDYINAKGLDLLFKSFNIKIRPNLRPTYIVCSGNGLHLYYKFKKPLAMFEHTKIELSQYKKLMTIRLWDGIADPKQRIQQESINQAFRIVGTQSKGTARAMAFKVGGEITLDYIKDLFEHEYDYQKNYKVTKYSLDECQKKFPEWYQKRIINGEPRKSLQFKKHRAVYDAWKNRIIRKKGGAISGTRYYCLEQLCATAVVCNISRDELVKDCYEILPIFESRTISDDNHFTEFDVKSALYTYDNPNDSTYCRKLWTIKEKTGIYLERVRRNGVKQELHLKLARFKQELMYPNGEWRNKDGRPSKRRNGVKQELHLKLARFKQELMYPNGEWRNKDGRPSKEKEVQEWQELNPNGTKAECHRATKISRPTIDKFWRA